MKKCISPVFPFNALLLEKQQASSSIRSSVCAAAAAHFLIVAQKFKNVAAFFTGSVFSFLSEGLLNCLYSEWIFFVWLGRLSTTHVLFKIFLAHIFIATSVEAGSASSLPCPSSMPCAPSPTPCCARIGFAAPGTKTSSPKIARSVP